MDRSQIRTITVDDVWAMLLRSWELVRFNYGLTLIICFVFAFGGFLSIIPLIGPLIGGAVTAVAPLVFLKAAFDWENGRESSIHDLTAVFSKKTLLQRMLPLLLIHGALYAAPQLIAQIPYFNILFAWLGLFTWPINLLVSVAIPILYFNESLNYQKSLSLALDGIIKNIGPFLVGVVLLATLLMVCTILLVLPLFFIGVPVLFVFQYLWYRVVYEGLTVEVPDKAII